MVLDIINEPIIITDKYWLWLFT